MELEKALEINGQLARVAIGGRIGDKVTIPDYSLAEMIQARDIVAGYNKTRTDKVFSIICDDRIIAAIYTLKWYKAESGEDITPILVADGKALICVPAPKERTCRVCGCMDDDCSQCIEKTGQPCHWVEEDLCSACVGEEPCPFKRMGNCEGCYDMDCTQRTG
jgi:hypothetical protein